MSAGWMMDGATCSYPARRKRSSRLAACASSAPNSRADSAVMMGELRKASLSLPGLTGQSSNRRAHRFEGRCLLDSRFRGNDMSLRCVTREDAADFVDKPFLAHGKLRLRLL